ncbi:MAG TPA: esterase-like activity of phytase family protein, partial [Thermoanaerobaculia bacterium]|nr:esterase-like activity of phytase family protein [Thermoanaerobaculia bacterium]
AIVRAQGDTYYSLVDNQKAGEGDPPVPARIFELEVRVTPSGPAAEPRSAIRLEGLDGVNFDGEGLALTPQGTFLVSSEKEPFLREVSKTGKTLRLLPVPPRFALSEDGPAGIRHNSGFEALSLSADGRTLWTANETALKQDAPDEEAALYGRHPIRLLRYERRGDSYEPAGELVYVVDPIERRGSKFKVRGVVDLLPLPEGGLLSLEREYVEDIGMEVQLFLVDTDGATDVSGVESLAAGGWTPVRKTLLYDFGPRTDNLEGMTFGPELADGDRTLVLVSDDNFDEKQATQVVALRLHSSHSATRGGS